MERPFTEKYRPQSISDIQGHNQAVSQVLNYVQNYSSQKKKGLLLHGMPGCGKTSLAHAVANELGLEMVEVNASDVRNPDAIKERIGGAMQQMSLFGTSKLILFDEMDGLSGRKDRGGISTLLDLLKDSPYPVILTANDPWNKKFQTLRKYVEMIELKTLAYTSILSVLKKVCDAEGIMYEEAALKQLARRAGGDLRGALTDLQTLGENDIINQKDLESLSDRRKAESMFTALTRVLKGSDPIIAKQTVDVVDEDLDEVFTWIDENAPREYTKGPDVVRAMDALSRADVMRGRIRRWQHWRFLVYQIDWMTAGVALAKEEKYSGFTKMQRSNRGLAYWRAASAKKKRDAIAVKVGEVTHTSTKVARESTLPFIAQMLKKNKKSELVEYFSLDKEEVDWLVKKA